MTSVLWITLAGALGALLRFGLTLLIPRRYSTSIPVAILVVNSVGSLIAGVTLAAVAENMLNLDTAVIVWAGLCGGLTTFSTFAVDTVQLHRVSAVVAWRNILLNVILGVGGASLGFLITQALFQVGAR